MKYLYDNLIRITSQLRNKCIFIFLDYDGTITPIARRPRDAVLAPETRRILRQLSEIPCCTVAVISGRSLDEIKGLVRLQNIIYIGNHGFQVEGPAVKFTVQLPDTYRKTLKRLKTDLQKRLFSIDGAFLEDKDICLVVHYRLVAPKDIRAVKSILREITASLLEEEKICITSGKMVFEIRPPIEWHKGEVVSWLLHRHSAAYCTRPVFPIYIGDDLTDEDAFKVIKSSGLAIVVGKTVRSDAGYYVRNTKDVVRFLALILNRLKRFPQARSGRKKELKVFSSN